MRKPLRFKRKKKRVSFLRKRHFWYATGLLFFLTFLFYTVVFSPWLEIQNVEVQGTKEIPIEHIVVAAENSFWQGFLGIPQNSTLLVDTKALKANLLNSFPAISQVSLSRSLPKTLVINIQEREQVAIWCLPVQAGKEDLCVALDSRGVAYKEIDEKSAYVVFYSEGNPVLGQELMVPSLLSVLLSFKETFERAGESAQLSTVAFEIGQRGQVKALTQRGWEILLDLEVDITWQITKLQMVLKEKAPVEKRGDLEYIDLRFGDQAYLKYRD